MSKFTVEGILDKRDITEDIEAGSIGEALQKARAKGIIPTKCNKKDSTTPEIQRVLSEWKKQKDQKEAVLTGFALMIGWGLKAAITIVLFLIALKIFYGCGAE